MCNHTVTEAGIKLKLDIDAGFSAYGSQMSQTIALKMTHAPLATAMSYLSVVWGIMSGYLVFGEVSSSGSAWLLKYVCLCYYTHWLQEPT